MNLDLDNKIKNNDDPFYQFINNCINNNLIYTNTINDEYFIYFESNQNENYNCFNINSKVIKYSTINQTIINQKIVFDKLKNDIILNKISYNVLLNIIEIYLNNEKIITDKIKDNIDYLLKKLVQTEKFKFDNIVEHCYIMEIIDNISNEVRIHVCIIDRNMTINMSALMSILYLNEDVVYEKDG